MQLQGRVWKFGDDIDTDAIIPARYLNTSDPHELAKHCMEDIEAGFSQQVKPGDIIVAGKNFGSGSSREHAPLAIKAAGISCVLAGSYARIFYRNAFNIGLPIFEAPQAISKIWPKDTILVDPGKGKVINLSRGEEYQVMPIPPFMQEIISAGGLIEYIKKTIKKSNAV